MLDSDTDYPSLKPAKAAEDSFLEAPSIVQSVNKNAYEIRADILHLASSWIQWQHHCDQNQQVPNIDKVLETAKKFYSFVENRTQR